MPSEGQAGLGEFGTSPDRPTAEAQAVAGGDRSAPRSSGDTDVEADGHIEVALQSIDYTVERTDTGDERPIIHIFGRDSDDEAEHIRVRGFRPYFYVPDEEVDRAEADDRITDTEPGFEAIDGESVTRLYAQTPRDVGQVRDEYTHYEADVRFPNRLLIDRGINRGVRVPERRGDDGVVDVTPDEVEPADVTADPRVFFFDIEVDDRRGFPEDGEEPIISIAAHDSGSDAYLAWLFDAPAGDGQLPDELADFEPIRDDTEVEVRCFDDEPAMLDDFLGYVEDSEVDLWSGWNLDDFDAPYLLDRLERLDDGTDRDLSIERLSRVDEVWRSNFGGPDIKGRVVFDLLYAYRRTQFTELDSYRLDDVAEVELGIGKERYPGSIGDLWEEDPERLLEYNVRDVELCVELDRKQQVIAFWDEVRSLVGCQLEDAPTPGDTVDMYILHKVYGDYVLPSRGRQQGEAYEGGAVFEPISGIRENVSVQDLKSLYPMCMRTINASPETKVDPDTYDGPTYRSPDGIHFRTEPDGIIREMVDELLAERDQKKRRRDDHDPDTEHYDMYDRQQGAVKVLMNCFTPDTEVVTPDGIVGITDLEVGDKVYSIDPETLEVECKPVVETHQYPDYRGPLVDLQSSHTDLRVTPNHRLVTRQNDKNGITEDGWSFTEAGDLNDYCRYEFPWRWTFNHGERRERIDLTEFAEEYEVWVRPECHGRTFTTELGFRPPLVVKSDLGVEGYVLEPEEFEEHRDYVESIAEHTFIHTEANRKWIDRTYNADDFVQLLAWYIAEGSVYTSEERTFGDKLRGSATTIQLAQNRQLATDGGGQAFRSIKSLLDRMGFDYYESDKGFQFTSKLLGNVLEELAGRGSEAKRIPAFIFDLSAGQKQLFMDRLLRGDGSKRKNTWRYSTKSDRLKDDVVRLAVELGYTPRVRRDSGVWRILSTEGQKNTIKPNRHASRSRASDGVYCVTVEDTNTLLAGRNGKYQFVGNSLYGTLGWTRFRLYDKDLGAAVTATGRSVIEYTADIAEEAGQEVVYGDSVTGNRPVVVQDPDDRVRVLPIETLFSLATAQETAVVADGGALTQLASKDRRTLDGWRALSLSEDGTAEWQPISAIIRHETDKPVVRLQHPLGESTTTRDHSYVVEHDGTYEEAEPAAVETPIRIPEVPAVERVTEIDLYEELGTGLTAHPATDVDSAPGVDPADLRADDAAIWLDTDARQSDGTPTRIKRHIDFTREEGTALLRLLAGALTGALREERSTLDSGLTIPAASRDHVDDLRTAYNGLVDGGHTRVNHGASSESPTSLHLTDDIVVTLIRGLTHGPDETKQVPWFVHHLEPSSQEVFLKELSVAAPDAASPGLSTGDQHLIGGLSTLLLGRRDDHRIEYEPEGGAYRLRSGGAADSVDPTLTEVSHDGVVYDLSVEGNNNFVDAIGGIVLHNTDSVMMELGREIDTDDALEQSFELEDRLNDSYDDFASKELGADEHFFEIEFEKLYRRFFQAGKKKRYAGHIVWKEGKAVDDIDITGFEYQRSDIAQITKEVQHEVLERIVREGDVEGVKDYLHDIITRFEDGEFGLDEIAIPGGIGKRLDNYETDTAHVRGAKYANLLLGTNFDRGSKPKRLYLRKVHPDYFERIEAERGDELRERPRYEAFKKDPDVICFEYPDQVPDEFRVDYSKMLDKTLKGPIERILEALDLTWDEVKAGQTQTGLGQF